MTVREQIPCDVCRNRSAKDKAVVRSSAERSRKEGLKLWFGEWEIPLRLDTVPRKASRSPFRSIDRLPADREQERAELPPARAALLGEAGAFSKNPTP
jgi:hypothetical protein